MYYCATNKSDVSLTTRNPFGSTFGSTVLMICTGRVWGAPKWLKARACFDLSRGAPKSEYPLYSSCIQKDSNRQWYVCYRHHSYYR